MQIKKRLVLYEMLLCFIESSPSASALKCTVSRKNEMQIRTVDAFNSCVLLSLLEIVFNYAVNVLNISTH